jgi:hypothetical protein
LVGVKKKSLMYPHPLIPLPVLEEEKEKEVVVCAEVIIPQICH